MKISILAISAFMFCSWEVLTEDESIKTMTDEEDHNPMSLMAATLKPILGLQCRNGFNNLSDEVYDAIYHCADVTHTKESRILLSKEKVHFDGPTPLLCMRSCFVRNIGIVNSQSNSYIEENLYAILSKWFSKPGGQFTAKEVTDEIMVCFKKHDVVFPKYYDNCTDTQDHFQCLLHVLVDCRDRKAKDTIPVGRAFARSSIDLDSS